MSPDTLGKVFLAVVIIDGLCLIFGFSLKASLMLYVIKFESFDLKRKFYSSVVLLTIISSLLLILAHLFFGQFLYNYLQFDSSVYLLISISSVLGLFFPLIISFYQALERVKYVFFLNFSYGIVSISLVLIFVIFSEDKLVGYLYGYLGTAIYGFLAFIILSIKLLSIPSFNFVRIAFFYSMKFFPTDLFAWIVNFSDRIMLYKMESPASNGLYTTAYKFGQSCDVVYNSVNKALTPIVYRELLRCEEEKSNGNGLVYIYNILFLFFTLICSVVILISPYIISLLSAEYQSINVVLILILLAYLCNAYKFIIDKPLTYFENFVKYKSYIWFFTATINLLLNFILIPKFGITGAASATLIAFVLTLLPTLFIAQKAFYVRLPYLLYFGCLLCLVVITVLTLNYYIYSFLVTALFSVFAIVRIVKEYKLMKKYGI